MGLVSPKATTDNPAQKDGGFVSGFVGGLKATERPSANLPSRSAKQGSSTSFVPLRDLGSPQQARAKAEAPLRDAGDGKLALKDINNGEFEPGWGVETKPRSQREIFLAEQAFAKGKQQGEEEASKPAHERGLAEGRESGYKQGFQDGEKERAFALEQRAEELAQQITDKRIETIATFLEQLMQREKEASHKRDTELMALTIAIFDKVLPALAQENGEKEVQLFLKAILQRFENIPQMTITLAEGAQPLVSMLRGEVDALLSDDKSVDTLVSFHFDPSFSKADCKIAWAEGEVERRFNSLWQEVKQALQQHLPNANAASEQGETAKKAPAQKIQEKTQEEVQDRQNKHQDKHVARASEQHFEVA